MTDDQPTGYELLEQVARDLDPRLAVTGDFIALILKTRNEDGSGGGRLNMEHFIVQVSTSIAALERRLVDIEVALER